MKPPMGVVPLFYCLHCGHSTCNLKETYCMCNHLFRFRFVSFFVFIHFLHTVDDNSFFPDQENSATDFPRHPGLPRHSPSFHISGNAVTISRFPRCQLFRVPNTDVCHFSDHCAPGRQTVICLFVCLLGV